jgi:hypothetical protein
MNASDPSTPPDILASLARSKKASVRRAVAENPNTPVEILNGLWESLPASLLANPILAFWELTEPGALLEHISERVLLATYNHLRKAGEDLPPLIYTHESLKHVMECALDRCDTRVFDHAPHDPAANLRLIFLAATMRYSRSRFFYEKAPAAAWRALASDPHPEVRLRFAELLRAASSSVETPSAEFTEAARALAESGGEDVFLQLAHCPAIPADVARRLASSESMEIRRTLAHCVNMPADSIELLCKEPDESVRLAFAKKSRLNQAHELLLRDASHKVRESLAANFRVRRQILSQFDMKDQAAVLKNVFLNSHAGDQLRHRIFMEDSRILLCTQRRHSTHGSGQADRPHGPPLPDCSRSCHRSRPQDSHFHRTPPAGAIRLEGLCCEPRPPRALLQRSRRGHPQVGMHRFQADFSTNRSPRQGYRSNREGEGSQPRPRLLGELPQLQKLPDLRDPLPRDPLSFCRGCQ